MPDLMSLPPELLREICTYLRTSELPKVARCSKQLFEYAIPLLYHTVKIRSFFKTRKPCDTASCGGTHTQTSFRHHKKTIQNYRCSQCDTDASFNQRAQERIQAQMPWPTLIYLTMFLHRAPRVAARVKDLHFRDKADDKGRYAYDEWYSFARIPQDYRARARAGLEQRLRSWSASEAELSSWFSDLFGPNFADAWQAVLLTTCPNIEFLGIDVTRKVNAPLWVEKVLRRACLPQFSPAYMRLNDLRMVEDPEWVDRHRKLCVQDVLETASRLPTLYNLMLADYASLRTHQLKLAHREPLLQVIRVSLENPMHRREVEFILDACPNLFTFVLRAGNDAFYPGEGTRYAEWLVPLLEEYVPQLDALYIHLDYRADDEGPQQHVLGHFDDLRRVRLEIGHLMSVDPNYTALDIQTLPGQKPPVSLLREGEWSKVSEALEEVCLYGVEGSPAIIYETLQNLLASKPDLENWRLLILESTYENLEPLLRQVAASRGSYSGPVVVELFAYKGSTVDWTLVATAQSKGIHFEEIENNDCRFPM